LFVIGVLVAAAILGVFLLTMVVGVGGGVLIFPLERRPKNPDVGIMPTALCQRMSEAFVAGPK